MGQLKTTSERIDNLPLLIHWLKQMQVDVIIDRVLGPAHGNWEGLSYGEVALVFVAYVVIRCTHFLSPMQGWARTHLVSLSQALGKGVREQDFTDDRLGILLSRLGDEVTRPGELIEEELGRQVLRVYDLPTDTARIDMTTVSVHHQPTEENNLMHFGHSKDHRPDLRQFKEVLATLDPVGMPLVTATVSGDQADDPLYVPAWERLVATLGVRRYLRKPIHLDELEFALRGLCVQTALGASSCAKKKLPPPPRNIFKNNNINSIRPMRSAEKGGGP